VTNISVDVLVIGAGIMGLTTALSLVRDGMSVRVLARDLPHATTSCAAGAIWGPFGTGRHEDARGWAFETLKEFRRLADDPKSGIAMVEGLEVSRVDRPVPGWLLDVGAEPCDTRELPSGYRSGWRYETAVIDMPPFLTFLTDELARHGVRIEQSTVTDLAAVVDQAAVTVNCSGAGARDLASDRSVRPVGGRVVIVENPGVHRFFAEFEEGPEMTYLIPHRTCLVLGSTREEPDQPTSEIADVTRGILRRCAAVEPAVARARVIGSRRGLRPVRPRIRLEQATVGSRPVVHNYGHGGGGVSVSWGCAEEVRSIVQRLLHAPRTLNQEPLTEGGSV
jgi:D-amino-acid oxidase